MFSTGTPLSLLSVFFLLISTAALWRCPGHFPHLAVEEAEAQRGQGGCLSHTGSGWRSRKLNPDRLAPGGCPSLKDCPASSCKPCHFTHMQECRTGNTWAKCTLGICTLSLRQDCPVASLSLTSTVGEFLLQPSWWVSGVLGDAWCIPS